MFVYLVDTFVEQAGGGLFLGGVHFETELSDYLAVAVAAADQEGDVVFREEGLTSHMVSDALPAERQHQVFQRYSIESVAFELVF